MGCRRQCHSRLSPLFSRVETKTIKRPWGYTVNTITYQYDQLNRMKYVRNSSGTALASYTYDSRSRRTALDYVNGAGADYSYDATSRLLYVDNQTANGQHKYAYTYDYVGNRSWEYRVYAGRTGLFRLKAVLRTGMAAA